MKGNRGLSVKWLAALILGATLLALLSTAQAGAAWQGGRPIPWVGLLKAQLANWYIYALFVPVLYRFALLRPVIGEKWRSALLLSALAGLGCALAKEMLYVTVGNWFRPGVFRLPDILEGDYFDEVLFFWGVIALAQLYLRRKEAKRAAEAERPQVDRFTVPVRGGFKVIRVEDVEWIEAEGNYVRLHTAEGAYLLRDTLTALEQRLGPRFVRIRRNALIDRHRLDRAERLTHGEYRLILSSGTAVISGRSYNQAVRALTD
jgi:hypothetical protein